jgi:hypothetical protein
LPWNFITLTCSLIYLKKIKYRLIFCFTWGIWKGVFLLRIHVSFLVKSYWIYF